MSPRRLAIALILPLALSAAGCASQTGGAYNSYDVGGASSLGGPRTVKVAEATAPSTGTTQQHYVYRGGRDPITGRAAIQEGRGASR